MGTPFAMSARLVTVDAGDAIAEVANGDGLVEGVTLDG
jgi:hypothetical protein